MSYQKGNTNTATNLISPIQSMLQSQTLLLLLQNKSNVNNHTHSGGKSGMTHMQSYMYMTVITTILASIVPILLTTIGNKIMKYSITL